MEKQNVLKLVSPVYVEIMQMNSFSSHLSPLFQNYLSQGKNITTKNILIRKQFYCEQRSYLSIEFPINKFRFIWEAKIAGLGSHVYSL